MNKETPHRLSVSAYPSVDGGIRSVWLSSTTEVQHALACLLEAIYPARLDMARLRIDRPSILVSDNQNETWDTVEETARDLLGKHNPTHINGCLSDSWAFGEEQFFVTVSLDHKHRALQVHLLFWMPVLDAFEYLTSLIPSSERIH